MCAGHTTAHLGVHHVVGDPDSIGRFGPRKSANRGEGEGEARGDGNGGEVHLELQVIQGLAVIVYVRWLSLGLLVTVYGDEIGSFMICET